MYMIHKFLLPVIFILALSLVYINWILPGDRVANDFQFISHGTLKLWFDLPYTWSEKGSEGLGEHTTFTLWSWPSALIAGALGKLGLSFSIVERILLVLLFFIPATIGIWKLGHKYQLSDPGKLIFLFFYLTNSYIL